MYNTIAERRDRFGNRFDFYFAAIGSAVGFGNIWRFPSLAYEYGGGAFFIPYLMALFFIGIPMLLLEIVLGQFYQTGAVGVFTSFHKRLSGVGVSGIACGYILVTYYSVLIAWCVNLFFDSGSNDAPWDYDGNVTNLDAGAGTGYFFNETVGAPDNTSTRLVPANVGYSLLVWFILWASTSFGIKLTGRITYFTMGFPILLLLIFLFKGISLEGSGDGIKAYIGEWKMDVLKDKPDCWSKAVSQIFFSLSVTFGVMTAYASHLPRNEPAFFNSCVVAISNCTFSFLAGFAVYAAIGHLAHLKGIPVANANTETLSLVFGTWPTVFSTFKNGEHWVRLLFLNLILLGIDSAFSIVEGIVTVLTDTYMCQDVPKWIVTGCVCVSGFFLSFIYCTDAGVFWLDTIDFYINFMLIIVGFFESFGVGWIYGINEQVEKFGLAPVIGHMFSNFGAIILGCGLWYGLDKNAVWGGFLGFFLFWIVGMMATKVFLKDGSYYELAFGNVIELREKLQPVVGYVPAIWCLLIKQIVPHVLLVLCVNLATTKTDTGKSKFGHYEGYPTRPYQILGILSFCFAVFLFLLGAIFPPAYNWLQPRKLEPNEETNKGDEVKA